MVKVEKSITASFDVDPQCGFTPLCPDELPVEEGHLISEQLNEQAKFASYRVVSKDCHPAEAPWMATSAEQVMTPVEGEYPNLDIKWPAHCVVGTKGNSLIPGLPNEVEYDFVVEKGVEPEMHPYGACYHDLSEQQSTGVIEWLKEKKVNEVIVGGLATDYCVKTTVLQLVKAGFKVILNKAACRGIADDSIQSAYQEMQEVGVTLIASSRELAL
ncbi:isochorismatase family protein [Psychromonas sp. 14N.309.X.WAT.B.A12]|uniref:isochorismatase family protein n=1 Tax=unclassified Psychromonas TaxID=2614957 RepID=UPI0025B23FFA|nr:isochorismatase family protein [Psychromonas sp. 14N.309.X.WAT.B.A12]MDN2661919.1 isochorismatase family protein [Psychromonas sp. 14N.309.X.WAT.B.A12]